MERIIIKIADDVKAFIQAQDDARQHACATFIASRAALRVAPAAIQFYEFHNSARERDLTSLVLWRHLLVSSLAATVPTDDIKAAARLADAVAADAPVAVETVAKAASVARFAARAADTVAADIWAEVLHDAALWLEHASQRDGTLAITIAPLWSTENPLEHDWHNLSEKLLASDTPDKRGADWSFWVKWYDDILAGNPQNWKMLHEIAITFDINWKARARKVNDRINGIVEKFENVKLDQDKVDTLSERQKVSPPSKVDGGYVAESLQRHAPALPSSLDAISFIIKNEIKRLQEKNYQDDSEAAEAKRLINVFMSILRATQEMSAHVPVDRKVEKEDTEAAKTLIRVYHEEFSSWARTSAPDLVDGTCRMGLVAGATGILAMCGAPVMVAAGIAGLAFGGPRLKDVGKTVKDALKD
jgi:SOS response regulatory protein OraA/RecX